MDSTKKNKLNPGICLNCLTDLKEIPEPVTGKKNGTIFQCPNCARMVFIKKKGGSRLGLAIGQTKK